MSSSQGNKNTEDGTDSHNDEDDLGDKVLAYIQNEVDKSNIRAAKLAAHLGISVDDAEAELCGLLSATGCGSFRFERQNSDGSSLESFMVFSFPDDISRVASVVRRRESLQASMIAFFNSFLMFLRFLAGIGIFISIAIVSLIAIIAIVAALIALLSNNNNRHGHGGSHRLRSIIRTFRECLWLYAMFGGGGNPFFRDLAMETSFGLSMMYLSPFSPFFWINMVMMNRRRNLRHRRQRGWSRNNSGSFTLSRNTTEEERPFLAHPGSGSWTRNDTDEGNNHTTASFSNALVMIDEFLFGPSDPPGPVESDRWRLRAAVILNKTGGIISLSQLLPYVDFPPRNQEITHPSLEIVSHFRGKPVFESEANENVKHNTPLFCFRELSESVTEIDFMLSCSQNSIHADSDYISGSSLPHLCRSTSSSNLQRKTGTLPSYLVEQNYRFTNLTQYQFCSCVFISIMNYIGVAWAKSLVRDEMVVREISFPLIMSALNVVFSCLHLYSLFFLIVPVLRFIFYFVLNIRINKNNKRRYYIASNLNSGQAVSSN